MHSWGEWKVTKAPTATRPGIEMRTCTRDGCGETETREIPATGPSQDEITGQCGTKLNWTLKDGVLTISGTGAMWAVSNDNIVDLRDHKNEIEKIVFKEGATSISAEAFSEFYDLREVTLPSTLTSIGSKAFGDCSSLVSISIPEKVTSIGTMAFAGCSSITSLYIPASLTSIGTRAFEYMTDLETITVATGNGKFASVDGILYSKDMTKLIQVPMNISSVSLPEGLSYIQTGAMTGLKKVDTVTIPESVFSIAAKSVGYDYTMWSLDGNEVEVDSRFTIRGYADSTAQGYARSNGITFVTLLKDPSTGKIGDNVTYELKNKVLTIFGQGPTWDFDELVNTSPFLENENITKVIVQEGVTKLGDCLFKRMTALSSVSLPQSLTAIEGNVFDHCTSLKTINIPQAVTTIGGYAFYYCGSLETITLPEKLISLGDSAFDSCSALKALVIPDGIRRIPYNLCQNCTALASVKLPEDLMAIDWNAFSNCPALASIELPTKNAIILSEGIFYNTAFDEVTIPDNVTSIGDRCFGFTEGMEKIAGFTIRGYDDTAAEKYANDNGFVFISLGKAPDRDEVISGTCGDTAVWEIKDDVLTISGGGSTGYWRNTPGPWAEHADKFSKIVVSEGITEIGENSFEYLTVKEIVLPESLTEIGAGAFEGVKSITELTIPAGVKTIGNSAFMDSDIKKLTVLGEETVMEARVFGLSWDGMGWKPVSGREIYGHDGSPAEVYALENEILFHSLEGSPGLVASGTCGDKIKWAFREDGTLMLTGSGPMPDYTSVLSSPWKDYALDIKKIVVGEGITTVGDSAFGRCDNVEEVHLPTTVMSIGFMGFYYLRKLTTIKLPVALTEIEGYAFQGCGFTSLVIPEKVKKIGGQAFSNCEQMTTLTLPSTMELLEYSSFSDCKALTSVSIPSGMAEIRRPFNGCSSLKTVYIPSSVKTIKSLTFHDSRGLTDVYYGGSASDWKKITIEKNNTPLLNAKLHYAGSDPNALPFKDVKKTAYYATPVAWAVQQGITAGTSTTAFSPDAACTRGQVVTFLWRAAGQPEPKTKTNPFKDVKSTDYFYKAVLWAAENKITSGTSATTFAPKNPCTRAQVVTFQYRAAGSPVVSGTNSKFTDIPKNAYYEKAVIWAVQNGITSGTAADKFSPGATCTRGQIVTFLYRA